MEQNLPGKTGKSLVEWKALLATKSFVKHGEIMSFLKGEMGITHGYANFIALKFREADAGSVVNKDDLVTAQYKGKETLRPILDELQKFIVTLGTDVEIAPKKASVSFRRKRQFALVQPSTKTRVDLGLKFNDRSHGDRLGTSGPFGAMCTHRVQLNDVAQVDAELLAWIKEAYNEAG
jgi:predicted transport protein